MPALSPLRRILRPFIAVFAAALVAIAPATRAASPARLSTTVDSATDGSLIVEAHGVPPAPPLFFSATAEQTVKLGAAEILGETHVKLHVVQGRPETLTLGLSGDGEVLSVSGAGLRDWSVRQGVGAAGPRRFLDLRPVPAAPAETSAPADFDLTIRTRLLKPSLPGTTAILLLTPGDAVGFASKIALLPDAALDFRVTAATGVTPLGDPARANGTPQFFATGEGRIEARLTARGAALPEAELVTALLSGQVNEPARSVEFHLRGTLRAQKIGARLHLLSGSAALSHQSAGDGWHVELVALSPGQFAYDLVGDREGSVPFDLSFAAAIRETGDWRALDFSMPAGAVVPLVLDGLDAGVSFKPDSPVVPATTAQGWQGFLPADGSVSLAWKHAHEAAEGALFFTSTEQAEVRLGAGLLRQASQLTFRILQGKLGGVRCRLDGPGEILGVEGANVVGWKVVTADRARVLQVQFSRPIETEGTLVIRSQTELGNWPVRAEPLRLIPEGGVRHSGFLRLANSGAVRLEVAEIAGMMQLAPAQFPGAAVEAGARQVFVYRYPSSAYSYRLVATQIQAEVGVSAVATYELAETARVISAALELDVREAPLHDWTLRIPEDYTVVAVTGGDVADYAAEADAAGGTRTLRILFARAIEGRQLLQLRLEKNQSAAAGDWLLPPLQFPDAKTVRGHLGVVATPGYRLVPAHLDHLVEIPVSAFPTQTAGLQQAWRLRDADWSATVHVEALGQTVQADVFHLYSLKEGAVSASVLVNYFVVGAPATEWRIAVPAAAGNIDVTGQNVRRDWRREGDEIIVSLHQPVLGAATLLVTFEQPMSARGGTIQPGLVRPLGVQTERGFVQVVSPLQVKSNVTKADGGLLKLEPTELPAEYRLLSSAPSLAVYQYTTRPFALEMNVEWYTAGDTVDQVVDFARLSSQVSRDGQVATEAKFFVKTRGSKALRVVLPLHAKLWEARVDQNLVNARTDGDQTLIPLPARSNPNEPVVVALRLGLPAVGSGDTVQLIAPRAASAATVIDEWVVRGDTGRQLVPQGGNAELAQPVMTETGFEWISRRGALGTIVLLSLVGLGALLLRTETGWKVPAGLLVLGFAVGGAVVLTGAAVLDRRPTTNELTFAATMVPAGESVSIQLGNVGELRALVVGWGVAAAIAGLALSLAGFLPALRRRAAAPFLSVIAIVLIAAGLLAQRGGAALFFVALAVTVSGRMFLPRVLHWRRSHREELPPAPAPGTGATTVASILALLCVTGFSLHGIDLRAQPRSAAPSAVAPWWQEGAKSAQAMVQTWSIRKDRLFADLDVSVRGTIGDSFLLLRPPAVLTEFKGDGLRVGKVERDGQTAYYVAPERDGTLTAHVRYELPVPDRAQPLALPTGPAATQRVTLDLDQGGWEFSSPMAVQVLPTSGLGSDRSGATLVLAPHGAPVIRLQPMHRDLAAETTAFFAESAHLFVPGPGVVNGFTRVTIRPMQGRVSALDFDVPPSLTVGDVSRGPIGAWRFDPQQHRLHVAIEPAQAEPFAFAIETQLGAGELPFALAVEPLRTLGAAGDTGMIALAFGPDAQPEGIHPTGLSVVNVQDFDTVLLPRSRDGAPLATVQHVWRYGATGGRVELKVAPVAPEVRVTSRQLLTLDDDRLVMSVDLQVAIMRVGLFKLSFALPEGLEIEALSGPALSHWTESTEGTQRIVTLHLNGRTIGDQTFSLSLAGTAPRAQDAWPVPRLNLREATRQTGDVLVVPDKGLRLRATDREKVTQLDARSIGGLQPGTLAFRLLQEDWVLHLGIEVLDPWITLQSLQEITMREGQTLTRIAARYRVENAAVKHVQVKLPGLGDAPAATVRATGSAVSDIVRVAATPDLWEVRFQRGIAGDTDVQIEFQGPAAREQGQEAIVTPEFVGAHQAVQFVAIRSGGRLELDATTLPRGWTRTDWSAVPVVLQNRSDRSVPALCFRVAEPDAPLAVTVRRHEVAESLKLRVTLGDLMTLFAPAGGSLTAVDLKVDVLEKSTLRVRLPASARLFNTFVNGESVSAVREGDAWLFYVTPNTAAERTATVRLVYAVAPAAGGRIGLLAPSLSVPLENVTWRVVLPTGYDLSHYSGALRLREDRAAGSFTVEDYTSFVVSKRSADVQQAQSLLQQANVLLQNGDQEKASEAFSRLQGGNLLDAASNEDARVQLRNLKTQQTLLGLNTRRQRLYLDNNSLTLNAGPGNALLEQAASLNPLMQGKTNFNPQQFDQLMQGNTGEENAALRGIASRIVDQQLAAGPAPSALDVTLPERGRVLTFARRLQVDGAAPLALEVTIARITRTSSTFALLLLLAIAAIAAVQLRRPALPRSVSIPGES